MSVKKLIVSFFGVTVKLLIIASVFVLVLTSKSYGLTNSLPPFLPNFFVVTYQNDDGDLLGDLSFDGSSCRFDPSPSFSSDYPAWIFTTDYEGCIKHVYDFSSSSYYRLPAELVFFLGRLSSFSLMVLLLSTFYNMIPLRRLS